MIATFIDIVLVSAAVAMLIVPVWQIVMTVVSCMYGLGGKDNGPWLPSLHLWRRIIAKAFVGSVLIGIAASNLIEIAS